MIGIRRSGLLLLVLLLGIALGSMRMEIILLVTIPLILIWFVSFDEAQYKERLRQKHLHARHNYELKNELRH